MPGAVLSSAVAAGLQEPRFADDGLQLVHLHMRVDEGAQLDIVCSVEADESAAVAARIVVRRSSSSCGACSIFELEPGPEFLHYHVLYACSDLRSGQHKREERQR